MKPFGREKNLKGSGVWKKDYHIHHKNRKVSNWWEDIVNNLSRTTIKQNIKKDINRELYGK